MARFILTFLFLVCASCSSIDQQNPQNDINPYWEFKGFSKLYIGADPDRISSGGRYKAQMKYYDAPTPFRFFASVMLWNSGMNATLSKCGEYLHTDAESNHEIQKLKQPFEDLAKQEFQERGMAIRTSGNMLFSVRWEVSDVPTELSKQAPTNFCLVQTKVEVGERTLVDPVSGEDYTPRMNRFPVSLPPQEGTPLYRRELLYFVSAEKLRDVMEIELLEILEQMLPTLNGEIVDQCGIFKVDPVEECTRDYTGQILNQEEALRCADDAQDRRAIIAEIDRLKGRLEGMSSKMDTKRSYYVEELCPRT
ncbi:MAG: hypothetical protein AAF936_08955 [Pseudomonadota bacterium]